MIDSSIFKQTKNFPTEGVTFIDINPFYANPNWTLFLKRETHFEKNVVFFGIDARGFAIAAALAAKYNREFVMIRKKGKLPTSDFSVEYEKEYGTDSLEIQNIIKPDQKIAVICDDVVATGGTMLAAEQLVRKCGFMQTRMFAILNIKDLNLKQIETFRVKIEATFEAYPTTTGFYRIERRVK